MVLRFGITNLFAYPYAIYDIVQLYKTGCLFVGKKSEEVAVAWAAPESQLNCEYTLKTEVYSASMTIHEILCHGIHPFQELGKIPPVEKCQQVHE